MRAATSEFGTSRHFAAAQQFGRVWSEADFNHRAGFPRSAVHSRTVPPAWRSRYLESVADQLMPPTPIDDDTVRAAINRVLVRMPTAG